MWVKRDYLKDATEGELLNEVARRRQSALRDCSDESLREELKERGVDINEKPPNLVEK